MIRVTSYLSYTDREPYFPAGADIGELSRLTTGEAHKMKFLSDLNGAFERFSKPIIAAVEGMAVSVA